MLPSFRRFAGVISRNLLIAARLAGFALILVTLAGCSNSTELMFPERQSGVPPLGRYEYTGWYVRTDYVAVSGSFTITFASPDSIAGIWDVPQYEEQSPQPEGAFRLGPDAYSVSAEVSGVGSFDHLLAWDGATLSCSGQLRTSGHFGFNMYRAGCAMRKQ